MVAVKCGTSFLEVFGPVQVARPGFVENKTLLRLVRLMTRYVLVVELCSSLIL
jgi:hypothetical protein